MAGIEEFKKDFVLLLEAGFIAVNHADEDAALKLFKAAQLLKPENTLPLVGLGYLHLHKLELKQAMQLFRDVLKKEPNNEISKALLGMAMSMTTDKVAEGEKLLEELANKAYDPLIQHLATDTIDFVDRFVKKTPSPMEIQRRESKHLKQ